PPHRRHQSNRLPARHNRIRSALPHTRNRRGSRRHRESKTAPAPRPQGGRPLDSAPLLRTASAPSSTCAPLTDMSHPPLTDAKPAEPTDPEYLERKAAAQACVEAKDYAGAKQIYTELLYQPEFRNAVV